MKTKELIEYLSMFEPESEIRIIPADLVPRSVYEVSAAHLIYDVGQAHPVILLELGESGPLDEVIEEVADPCAAR